MQDIGLTRFILLPLMGLHGYEDGLLEVRHKSYDPLVSAFKNGQKRRPRFFLLIGLTDPPSPFADLEIQEKCKEYNP